MKLEAEPTEFMSEFRGATQLALSIHRDRRFLGLDIPHGSYVQDISVAARFAGADLGQMKAAMLHDALRLWEGDVESLRQRLHEEVGPCVVELIETCTPPMDNRPWAQRRREFLERLRGLPDDDPALLIFQVATHCKLQKMKDHWSYGSATMLRHLPGRDAHEKLVWFCELAMLFRTTRPGRLTEQISKQAQAFRNTIGDGPAPPDASPAWPFFRRRLYEAAGDRFNFPIWSAGGVIVSDSGTARPGPPDNKVRPETKRGGTYFMIIDPDEETIRFRVILKFRAVGVHRDDSRGVYQRFCEAIDEYRERIEANCREAGFDDPELPEPTPEAPYQVGDDLPVMTGSVFAKKSYETFSELVETLHWLADCGPGVEPDGFELARISVSIP